MNNKLIKSFSIILGLAAATQAFAYPQYTDQDNILKFDSNGVGGIVGIISNTLMSLSSLDEASKSHHIAIIEQAETEALNYDDMQGPSSTFLSAKKSVELLSGSNMTNSQAAVAIVEINQKIRD